jgi:hypothetical protein
MGWKIFWGVFLFGSFGTSQVIQTTRPQPSPLHAPSTASCCSLSSNSDQLMKCLNSLEYNYKEEVAIVTYATEGIYSYAAYSLGINSAYAEHNLYQFKILTPSDSNYEPVDARWNKVAILEKAMESEGGWAKDVSFLVWVDADLAILDLGMRIELIGRSHPEAEIIMSEDLNGASTLANSGYILVRNTPWAKKFLSLWWSYGDRTRMSDQSALTMMFETLPIEEQRKVLILPKDAVNTHFPPHIHQKDHNQVSLLTDCLTD